MKPVMQTKFGEDGNCFAACVASILEVSIDEVPWLKEPENWEDYSLRLNNYLKEKHNLKLFAFEYDLVTNHYPDILTDGFYIVSGKIEGGLEHSVIYKNGELVHDSNPKKNKIIKLEYIYLFIKIFK
jgi:hypothetical protein